jgi:hypothetical protein
MRESGFARGALRAGLIFRTEAGWVDPEGSASGGKADPSVAGESRSAANPPRKMASRTMNCICHFSVERRESIKSARNQEIHPAHSVARIGCRFKKAVAEPHFLQHALVIRFSHESVQRRKTSVRSIFIFGLSAVTCLQNMQSKPRGFMLRIGVPFPLFIFQG